MKRNHPQRLIFLLVALSSVIVVCIGQQPPLRRASQSNILRALVSADWTARARAYEKLRSDPAELRQPKVRTALLDLLNRENHELEQALRESHEQIGASGKFGEGYGQYIAELGETVDTFADWNDPRQVCIFVREAYDPSSQFAAKIAAHSSVSVPCLREMYASDLGVLRGGAAAVLVRMLGHSQDLNAETAAQIREIILHALHDLEPSVRSDTVNALGKFGGQDMLPALRQVAETDSAPEVQGHSVRMQAVKAIMAIERRAEQEPK